MPGLLGVIGLGAWDTAKAVVDSMTNAMRHEPFYKSSAYMAESQRVCVGWVAHPGSLLASMPAWNRTRDVCLILAGDEVSDLPESGTFDTSGPGLAERRAEHLLALYDRDDLAFLDRLNGWFCGLLVDFRKGSTVLFNDRYGFQRLYVHERDGGLYFASEAKALLSVLPQLRVLDRQSFGETFALGCVLENRTLFRGVSLLPPGSAWTVTGSSPLRKQTYFSASGWESQPPLGESEFCDALSDTFARVLPRYLQGSPGTLGMSLTGGLDGRMIMARENVGPGQLPCYTFVGPYRECADVRIARRIARMCGQSYETISVGEGFLRDFPALAEKAIYVSDGTMDITGAVELFVNRRVREIAPVRLTGNYGSEIIRRNVAFRPGAFPERLLDPEFCASVQAAHDTYRRQREDNDVSFVAFKQVPWHHYGRYSVESSQLIVRSPYLDNDLVSLAYRATPTLAKSARPALHAIAAGRADLAHVPTDRGLAAGRPIMETNVRRAYQEFTAKAEYAYDYGMPQWLARLDHLFAPLHPEGLFLGRHKFYHFRVWYRDRLSGYLNEVLLDPRARGRDYLNGKELHRIVDEHTRGVANHTSEIHRLLGAELLHRQLLERA